jgi:hypothetical protein
VEVEGSDMAIVFTPIFFRERSSVTDIEREYAGRGAAAKEKERGRGNEGNEEEFEWLNYSNTHPFTVHTPIIKIQIHFFFKKR